MAYKPYKMKGHTLPGINQKSEGNTDLPDGRSGSSPLQASYDLSKATVSNPNKVKGNVDKRKQSPKALLRAHKQQDKTVKSITKKAEGQVANPREYAINYLQKKGAVSKDYK